MTPAETVEPAHALCITRECVMRTRSAACQTQMVEAVIQDAQVVSSAGSSAASGSLLAGGHP